MRLILKGSVPSVNHQYKNALVRGRNMRILTDVAAAWEQETIILTKNWMRKSKWLTADSKVVVRLWYFYPDKRRRDAHNTLKLLLDALEKAGIYTDDKLALPQIMNFEIDRANPRVEIEFEVMNSE